MGDESFSILTFEDLWLGYLPGEYLLKQASDEVRTGEMIALAGRNGTGKSTLLRTIAGIRKPARGNVMLQQRSLFSSPPYELSRNISFVATGTNLVENLTVFEMVSLGRHPYTNWWGNIRDKDRRKIHESIHFVGMEDFTHARVHRLSDGERQRVMIAMSLAQDTRIMILDEPTAFLDIPNRIGILEVLHKLKSHGRTVIFSTHEFDNIFSYADKVWVIHEQKLVTGAPEDLGLIGTYEAMFSDSGVAFDTDNLRFLREGHYHRSVELTGDGILRYWTRRALERGGFRVSDQQETRGLPQEESVEKMQKDTGETSKKKTGENKQDDVAAIRVDIDAGKDTSAWNVLTAGTVRTFHTLYDLMAFLTHIV
ncbi:MAG: ABC transporter ATP-binding protein [Bacteroidales bacterium]|nr:ABC transporter ATP-binding protein [Bacteroidales bacterium]MDT8430940.1 ABC transporter ATP-binding protein [Bacteroidales bacterium]